MKCETCNVNGFVHKEFYCSECKDKPEPKIKKGRAYLFRKSAGTTPVCSAEVEVSVGLEHEMSAVELMRMFRIQFIENN